MARVRKGNSPGPIAMRKFVTKKKRSGAHSEARKREPRTQRIIEFPRPPAPDEVVTDTVIFEVGNDRFALTWTVEIERLHRPGPVAVQRKSRLSSDRSSHVGR